MDEQKERKKEKDRIKWMNRKKERKKEMDE